MFAVILLHLKNNAKIYLWIGLALAVFALGRFLYNAGKLAATTDFLDQQVFELKVKNEQLVAAQAELLKLQAERDQAISNLAKKESEIDQKTLEQIDEIQESHEDVVTRLRTTIAGLSDDLRVREANTETTKLAASVIADYARGQAKLSESAIRFLVREADRADSTAVQLGACQNLHRVREQTVNEYNQKYFSNPVQF
jgi:hypothetical protein